MGEEFDEQKLVGRGDGSFFFCGKGNVATGAMIGEQGHRKGNSR